MLTMCRAGTVLDSKIAIYHIPSALLNKHPASVAAGGDNKDEDKDC